MPEFGHNMLPSQTEILLDSLGLPAFLLDVEGPELFRFRLFNAELTAKAGLENEGTRGKHPHDVLPKRTADTVVANYEACRASAAPYQYDEVLDLPGGVRWWHTTLSPVFDADGNVEQIIGIASDVTHAKNLEMRACEFQELTDYIRSFASHAAHDDDGPLLQILHLLADVKVGFKDLGDNKLEQLESCERVTLQAIDESIAILSVAEAVGAQNAAPELHDLGHICRDVIAVVDPEHKFKITMPDAHVHADWVCLLTAIRSFFEDAVTHAKSEINLSLTSSDGTTLYFEMRDDREVSGSVLEADEWPDDMDEIGPVPSKGVESAMDLLRFNGGSASYGSSGGPGFCIKFSMPGQIQRSNSRAA